ncbi:MAG: PilZ domain-containing protein [Candidatus Korobacteraceae bacterium]|jgi:hypothetical protein
MNRDIKIVPPENGYPALRRWARYQAHLVTCLIAQKPKKAVIVPGRGSELNHGGMTVYAGVELAVNEHVRVSFTPPYSGESMTLQCVIRDRNGYTYGVEFIHDEIACDQSNQMQRILDAIEELKRK